MTADEDLDTPCFICNRAEARGIALATPQELEDLLGLTVVGNKWVCEPCLKLIEDNKLEEQ